MRRYHIQNRDDYKSYNKIAGMITKLTNMLRQLEPSDPTRIELTDQLLNKCGGPGGGGDGAPWRGARPMVDVGRRSSLAESKALRGRAAGFRAGPPTACQRPARPPQPSPPTPSPHPRRLHDMGVIPTKKSLVQLEKLATSAFCRRRLAVVMVRLKMCETVREAATFVEQGHVRVGPNTVTDPAFHVTRGMEDFVTWADTSKIKAKIMRYNDALDDYDLLG
jgi:hypothetical protein